LQVQVKAGDLDGSGSGSPSVFSRKALSSSATGSNG